MAYGGAQHASPVADAYAGNPFSPNQYAHPATYSTQPHAAAGQVTSGTRPPPARIYPAYDVKKMRKELEGVKREQDNARRRQEKDRERAERKQQAAVDRRDRRAREEANKKDLERLIKHQVRAEMRKQARDLETQSDPGRRRLEWENRLLLENVLRQRQMDDNQSLSSRGSRRRPNRSSC